VEIYLIRHTTPKIENGICYGHTDVPLAETFERECEEILRNIPSFFDAIYMSPATRCWQLGNRLQGTQHISDGRLMEMDFGKWELQRWNEIGGNALNEWMEDFVNRPVPGGESFIQLFKRVGSFMQDLRQEGGGEVAVVTHAGVIRCLLAHLGNLSLQRTFDIPVTFGSVHHCRVGRARFGSR
jgi:alpha-ribazole phosphatase